MSRKLGLEIWIGTDHVLYHHFLATHLHRHWWHLVLVVIFQTEPLEFVDHVLLFSLTMDPSSSLFAVGFPRFAWPVFILLCLPAKHAKHDGSFGRNGKIMLRRDHGLL